MNHRQNKICEDSESLLVKKITGELLSEEKRFLDNHLAQCAFCIAKEVELAKEWQSFDSLPAPEIPAELYEKTRETILGHLRQEKSLLPWAARIPMKGIWSLLTPFAAGLAMTGAAYGLTRSLFDPTIHHRYILIVLFSLWWMLFAGCFWLIFKETSEKLPRLNMVVPSSISTTPLTLAISFLAYEVDSLRWLALSAAQEVAVASSYLFGLGNTFVASWWIHCCLASFVGAFIFGSRRTSHSSDNLFLASLVVTILLSPAIYLQGSTHNHGLGLIAFAALGTYVGSLIGLSLGFFIRRQIFSPAT
ncbi:MAG: hypothetical protein HYY45_01215 [Deltaproteobacteria bacterium]|nr:hypothetical protein [Deltaproteobacteria bacterium]